MTEFEVSPVPKEIILMLIECTRKKSGKKPLQGTGTMVGCGSQFASVIAGFRLKVNWVF